jgi:hypothetical protein
MSVQNFIQTIWSHDILKNLELECKLVDGCLRSYEGDCKYAHTVKILGVGEPTITDYDGSPLTYEEMTDKGQELVIDKRKAFHFLVNDVDQAQSVPGLREEYQRKAIHGLAVARDTEVAKLIKSAPYVTTATALSREAVKEAIDAGIVTLRERNFNEEGRIELSPAVYNVFKNELITLSTDNPEYIKKGIVGMYDGFKVIMSNNMAKDSTHVYCDIRGEKAIAFAAQLDEVEALRHPNLFSDIVRGLDVFGTKIIDKDRIQVIKVPIGA